MSTCKNCEHFRRVLGKNPLYECAYRYPNSYKMYDEQDFEICDDFSEVIRS